GKLIVLKEADRVHIVKADTGDEVCAPIEADYSLTDSSPYAARFDFSGKRLVVPVRQGFEIVDSSNGKVLFKVHWEENIEPRMVSFSPDGSLVSLATWDSLELRNGPFMVFDAGTS